MEREHEDAMRADFADAERINAEAFRDYRAGRCSEVEFQQRINQYADIDDRWMDGPHREQWVYLRYACDDWQLKPKAMQRKLAATDTSPAEASANVSDVERRSLVQAWEIEQARAIERARVRRQIQRGR
ncbi:hypothetical protein ACIHDR_19485 [Nocardia sp. NPDC052278]|uniref:hypothetical protein n=1 Tax=unclassified Nocardia TaxID=2637762 RepID=UPI00368739CB